MTIKIEIVNGIKLKAKYKRDYIRKIECTTVNELTDTIYKEYLEIKNRLTRLIRIALDDNNEIGAWELSKQLDKIEEQEEKVMKAINKSYSTDSVVKISVKNIL